MSDKVTTIGKGKDKPVNNLKNVLDSIDAMVDSTNKTSENIATAITKHRFNMYQGYLAAGFDSGQALYLLGLEVQRK